jgi:hypothetical protein
MNLPGVDTYVCDASGTRLPNLPPAKWTQKIAYWQILLQKYFEHFDAKH